MQSIAKLGASLVLIFGACGVSAQTMYRCGSVYQDRPCETGAAAKVFRSSGAEAAPAATPRANPAALAASGVVDQAASPLASRAAPDPQCVRRGTDAQQIVWSRESGKTAEDQARQATSEYQRQLIAEVYAQRGTAPQVRDSVQARCQRDKETMGFIPYPPSAQSGNASVPQARPLNNSESQAAVSPPAVTSTYNRCDQYQAQRESLRAQERQGGSIQVMEALSQQRRRLEQTASGQGC